MIDNINLSPEYPYIEISKEEREKRTNKLLNSLDYKIIVSPEYLENVLYNNPYFWSFIHEGTLKGEPDKINRINVYFMGMVIVEKYKIGIYVFANELEKYIKKELKKSNKKHKKEKAEKLYNKIK